ncbi:MAG: class I SAM-dependent methyltransferase [Actinomycetota bacterium]|nr:methyltransferase domain-containing protein [Actinomycetota bacterium]
MRRTEPGLEDQIAYYREQAGHYDRKFWSMGNRDNRNHKIKIARLMDTLELKDGDSVLEVGTGTGLHARWLLDNVKVSYVGLDASFEMLEQARSRIPESPLLAADATFLPFPDGSLDAVFCSGALHHMDKPWLVLKEMARVTRSGGHVAVMEPNWKFPTNFINVSTQRVEWNCFKLSPRTVMPRLADAGLRRLKLERVLYTPPKPEKLIPFFDKVDRAVARTPGLRRVSLMLLASGTKP